MNIRREDMRILTIFTLLVFSVMFSPGTSKAALTQPATPGEVTMPEPALIGGDPVVTTFGIQNQEPAAEMQLMFNLVDEKCSGFSIDSIDQLQQVILDPGQILDVTVRFQPTALGSCSNDLMIWYDKPQGNEWQSVVVILTGEGVDQLPPPSTTVIIDGCDTGVTDLEFGDKPISEWIDGYAKDVKTHRHFVSRVARLTAKMRREGLISREEKHAIRNCARKANIPPLDISVGTSEKGTIIIDGRDTGVSDQTYEGYPISEYIQQCADDANTHGKFVKCVSHHTRDMKKAGVITWKEKHALQRYAAKAK